MSGEMKRKALKQLEFYFGDANLPKDKFLLGEMAKNDGWVAISVLQSFARMKVLEVSDTDLVEAVENFSKMLKMSDDKKMVARIGGVPEKIEDLVERTVHVSGMPGGVKLEDVEELFSKGGHKTLRVSLRNKEDSTSAFVLLEDPETVEKVLGQPLMFPSQEKELVVIRKKTHMERDKKKRKEENREKLLNGLRNHLLVVEKLKEPVKRKDVESIFREEHKIAFTQALKAEASAVVKLARPVAKEIVQEYQGLESGAVVREPRDAEIKKFIGLMRANKKTHRHLTFKEPQKDAAESTHEKQPE
ncbi:MAG: La ribonucleoprotein [Amphiamblys sp. WSBS2006]|nr:MAG: La ribonucleoprotein [Amphiamblys sp. WSBS2006]